MTLALVGTNVSGAEHPCTLRSVTTLGALYRAKGGEREKADALLRRALDVSNRTLGPSNPVSIAARIELDKLDTQWPSSSGTHSMARRR